MSLRLILPLLVAPFFGCAGTGAHQRPQAAARAGGAAGAPLVSGLQQPPLGPDDRAAVHAALWDDPHLAAQVATEDEREHLVDCIIEENLHATPTVLRALELGEEQLSTVREAIGHACFDAHREAVLTGEVWSESFGPVYTTACEAYAPEAAKTCRCFGAHAPEHFESPWAFHQLEEVLATETGPDADQAERFEALTATCDDDALAHADP